MSGGFGHCPGNLGVAGPSKRGACNNKVSDHTSLLCAIKRGKDSQKTIKRQQQNEISKIQNFIKISLPPAENTRVVIDVMRGPKEERRM